MLLSVGLVACSSPADPSPAASTTGETAVTAAAMWDDITAQYSVSEVSRVELLTIADGGAALTVTVSDGLTSTSYSSLSVEPLDSPTSPLVSQVDSTDTVGPAIAVDAVSIDDLQAQAAADSSCAEPGAGVATTPGGSLLTYRWCGTDRSRPSLVEVDGQPVGSTFTVTAHDDWAALQSFLTLVAPKQTWIMAMAGLDTTIQTEAVDLPDGTTGHGAVFLSDDSIAGDGSNPMFTARVMYGDDHTEGMVFSLQNYDLEPVWNALMEATGNDPERITSLDISSPDGVQVDVVATYATSEDDDFISMTLSPR